MLDKIKQQLNSTSVIQSVFSLKSLPISSPFNPHFLPAHHHFKGELLQPPQSLHYEEVYLIAIQNLSVSKHFLNSQLRLPSLTWCSKATCSSIFAPLLHCSSRMRVHISLANLPAFQFCTPGKSMHFNYANLHHHLPIKAGQSSVHPLNYEVFGR